MSKKQLSEKQMQVIELVVEGERSIVEICEMCGVGRSTYYDWKRDSKVFQDALNEAIELKVKEARQRIRINVNRYIDRLEKLSDKGKNEQAVVNAIKSLATLGELDPTFKQEINLKNDETENKNALLEMLKSKKQEGEE